MHRLPTTAWSGNLSGYGWSENAGWINFDSASGGGVTVNTLTGDFDGYAWGENVGWIHFQNASPAYKVVMLVPGITVTESGGSTSVNELGTTDTFTVVLDSKPASNVELSVTSADTGSAADLHPGQLGHSADRDRDRCGRCGD